MIEKALKGNRPYWIWMTLLLLVIVFGISAFSQQLRLGLSVTGLGDGACWGISAMQFTFMSAVAASSVLIVLPFYLHDYKPFGNIVVIAQFMGASASAIALLSLLIDTGKPQLLLDLLRYATPFSAYSWAFFLLNGYLLINLVTGWATLGAERKDVPVAAWVKPLIYLSIPWAIVLPVVTGLLFASFPGNHGTLSLLAIRLLASAFAAGATVLLLIILILQKTAGFDAGTKVDDKLVMLVTYAGTLTFVLMGVECVSLSQTPPLLWLSLLVGIASIAVFFVPVCKSSTRWLIAASAGVVFSLLFEKGATLLSSSMGGMVAYSPTLTEVSMTIGVLALGLLLLTILLKAVIAVKRAD